MERLSGLDASFLYLETPTLHMHVSMAVVVDPSSIPGGYAFERFRDKVTERLQRAPVFRRRLVEVPLRLGHPYWIEDPFFDIDYHLRRQALPSPGGIAELADLVGDVCGRPLDRAHPLWQMYLVEGLAGGRIAVVTKIHHSTIDGVSGAELLGRLFDLEPDPPGGQNAMEALAAMAGTHAGEASNGHAPTTAAAAGDGEAGEATGPAPRSSARRTASRPPDLVLMGRALADRATRPVEATRLAWRTGRAVLDVVRLRRSPRPGTRQAALPLTTPRTSLNAAITPHRRVALTSTSLDDVKAVKNALGCTVNDVVLALCTGALRRYLLQGGELPEEPLVATVPVSVEPSRARSMHGSNKVSAMWVGLPCAVADPIEQVELIRASTRGAKEEYKALGADVLVNWTEHASPNLFSLAARTYSRLRLADHHRPIHSLVVSNVPGPDFPIYLGGAEMIAGFPLGPITDGAGLNITVMSYRGTLNWGLMACRETVPGVGDIADGVGEALRELMAATGVGEPTPVSIDPPPAAKPSRSPRAATRATKAGATTSTRVTRAGATTGTRARGTRAAGSGSGGTNGAGTTRAGTNGAGTTRAGTNGAGTNGAGTNGAGITRAGTTPAETGGNPAT